MTYKRVVLVPTIAMLGASALMCREIFSKGTTGEPVEIVWPIIVAASIYVLDAIFPYGVETLTAIVKKQRLVRFTVIAAAIGFGFISIVAGIIFMGGSLDGRSLAEAIADGLCLAISSLSALAMIRLGRVAANMVIHNQ